MKLIYISGPYRDSRGEYYVRQNIRMAEIAALRVWQAGHAALCPHKNTAGLGGARGLADKVWLNGDLELLRRCDAIYLIEGWEDSAGAKAELQEALRCNIPVLYTEADLYRFIDENPVDL